MINVSDSMASVEKRLRDQEKMRASSALRHFHAKALFVLK
jgi:hypothetical protein